MAAGGLQRLFDELKAVVAEADAALEREASAPAATDPPGAPPAGTGSVAATAAALRDQADRVAERTDGYVRTHPWAAVGLALLAGFVAGALLKRK